MQFFRCHNSCKAVVFGHVENQNCLNSFHTFEIKSEKITAMKIDDSNWTYNEFLAFILVFGAEMNAPLTNEELDYIKLRTQIADIQKIKAKVDSVNDVEGLEVIEHYREKYLNTKDDEDKARKNLEDMLKTDGNHSQLEKIAVHLIEKLI